MAKELLGLMIHFNPSSAYLPLADSYVSTLVAVISTIPVNMPPPGGNFGILCTLGRYIDATVNGCFEPPLHPATIELSPMHASYNVTGWMKPRNLWKCPAIPSWEKALPLRTRITIWTVLGVVSRLLPWDVW